ncbi:AraC family transcriptional regulator [Shouchella shacheensis]|uniref:AraC family transcriptional regulator n=1 Tax=Shouchella shacheensis TaxID=1649580 RepID=UPI0007400AA0|nr:AraC family transcriptional regulator [Shouchella shacheensis]
MAELEQKTTYGFRFQDTSYPFMINIWNVGWEVQDKPSYSWDGQQRNDKDKVVFQYTLSGTGELELEGQLYTIGPQQAFFVSLPGNHRYYFPENAGEPWEFIYVTLEGEEALRMHQSLTRQYGPVLTMNRDAEPIHLLFQLYFDTVAGKVDDAYLGSNKAYEWLTSLFRLMKGRGGRTLKDPIAKAVHYIETSFAEPLTVDRLADRAGLSKYYFIKQFKEELDITPMQYVAIVRMKKAAALLSQTDVQVAEVAHAVGFDDPNYFNKVFKKVVGTSASVFRKTKEKNIVTEW